MDNYKRNNGFEENRLVIFILLTYLCETFLDYGFAFCQTLIGYQKPHRN
jgi:hypothetical protein